MLMERRLLPVKDLLRAVLHNEARPQSFNRFVNICIAIALTHLERKAASGQLSSAMFQLSMRDLAVDCIADLFRIDESGIPVQMSTYFECVNLDAASEEETLILLRRLVFSKVKHGLFRAYNEWDPSLGRILRNIKLGINVTGEFVEADRFGDTVLTPTRCDLLLRKPLIQKDTLAHILHRLSLADDLVPSMLSALSAHLRDQTEYCRIVPLLPLALTWRERLSAFHPLEQAATDANDGNLWRQDFHLITVEACEAVKGMMWDRYVKPGGIPAETYEAYFSAITASLDAKWDQEEGRQKLFELVKQNLPDLTEAEYKSEHRNTVEYLLKLARKRAQADLSKNLT